MRIPNAIDLDFEPIEGNMPETNCNNCGKQLAGEGFMADINVSDDETVSILVCSQDCVHAFQSHPCADEYIHWLINNAALLGGFL